MQAEGRVGPIIAGDGVVETFRMGRTLELSVSDTHPRYYEPVFRGNVFSAATVVGGVTGAATHVAPLSATSTPVVGVFNPANSGKVLSILNEVFVSISGTIGVGAPAWYVQPNAAITAAGAQPVNNYTGLSSGAVSKAFVNSALTGLVGTGTLLRFVTAANAGISSFTDLGGQVIVPQGGFAGIFLPGSGTTWLVAASISWEEIPV